jgi:hypothetical protein
MFLAAQVKGDSELQAFLKKAPLQTLTAERAFLERA